MVKYRFCAKKKTFRKNETENSLVIEYAQCNSSINATEIRSFLYGTNFIRSNIMLNKHAICTHFASYEYALQTTFWISLSVGIFDFTTKLPDEFSFTVQLVSRLNTK